MHAAPSREVIEAMPKSMYLNQPRIASGMSVPRASQHFFRRVVSAAKIFAPQKKEARVTKASSRMWMEPGAPVEVVACGEEEGMLPEFSAEQFGCDEDNGKEDEILRRSEQHRISPPRL